MKKNVLIPFLVFTTLTLSSCFKAWTCECETNSTTTPTQTGGTSSTAQNLGGNGWTATMFKKKAKQECDKTRNDYATSNGIPINDVNCELK